MDRGPAPLSVKLTWDRAGLNIRRDIPLQSPTVATVKHGERLEISAAAARFLSRAHRERGRRVDHRQPVARGRPTWPRCSRMGNAPPKCRCRAIATTYDVSAGARAARLGSPSFITRRFRAKEKFSVLAHVVMPRTDLPRTPLIPPAPKKAPPAKKESKAIPEFLHRPCRSRLRFRRIGNSSRNQAWTRRLPRKKLGKRSRSLPRRPLRRTIGA